MKEIKNFEGGPENKEQIIEGVIGKSLEGWEKKLPEGVKPEMADTMLGGNGFWLWHLKPEYIKDEHEREKYKCEKDQWDAGC